MITKFDSSYYGTVDMENLGYAGTPINERRYSQGELGGALYKVVEYAKCMDERGYDKIIRAVLDAACETPVVGSQRAVTRDSPGIMSLSSVPSTDKNSYGVLELKNSASPSGPPPPRLFVGKNTPG